VLLEEFIHLLEHFFDALADDVALLVESGDLGFFLGFGGGCGGLEQGQLGAEAFDFGFGGGAGFTLTLDDLYST